MMKPIAIVLIQSLILSLLGTESALAFQQPSHLRPRPAVARGDVSLPFRAANDGGDGERWRIIRQWYEDHPVGEEAQWALARVLYLPSNLEEVQQILDVLKERGLISRATRWAELGGGDARVSLLASRYVGHAVVIERAPVLTAWGRTAAQALEEAGIVEKDRVEFKTADLLDESVDLSRYGVLYYYALSMHEAQRRRFLQKLLGPRGLKPGAVLIIYNPTLDSLWWELSQREDITAESIWSLQPRGKRQRIAAIVTRQADRPDEKTVRDGGWKGFSRGLESRFVSAKRRDARIARISKQLRSLSLATPAEEDLERDIPHFLSVGGPGYWELGRLERRLDKLPRITWELFDAFDTFDVLSFLLRFDRATERRLSRLERSVSKQSYISLYRITDIAQEQGYDLWKMGRHDALSPPSAPSNVVSFSPDARRRRPSPHDGDDNSAADGGRGRSEKDFTIGSGLERMDLLEVALEGKIEFSQMETWIQILSKKDQLPIKTILWETVSGYEKELGIGGERLRALVAAGVIHRTKRKGERGYRISSQEMERIIDLTDRNEVMKRFRIGYAAVDHLIEQGLLEVHPGVLQATGAKAVSIASFNRLIAKEASLVPLPQLADEIQERYGISKIRFYKYVKNISTLIGRDRAQGVFQGQRDLTESMVRTVEVGDKQVFRGINLLNVLKFAKELQRIRDIITGGEWIPVSDLSKTTGISPTEIQRRIERGLLRAVTLQTTLNLLPREAKKTTFVRRTGADRVVQLAATEDDPEIGLLRIRRTDGMWNISEIVRRWKRLQGEQKEAFLFRLKWYNGPAFARSLFKGFEKTHLSAIPDVLDQVDPSYFISMTAERIAGIKKGARSRDIRRAQRMLDLLGRLNDARVQHMLTVIALHHPVPDVQSAAERSLKRVGRARDGGQRMTQAETVEALDEFLSTLGIERKPQEAVYQSAYMTSRALAAKVLLEEQRISENQAKAAAFYYLFPELDRIGLARLLGKSRIHTDRLLFGVSSIQQTPFERFTNDLRVRNPELLETLLKKVHHSPSNLLLSEAIGTRELDGYETIRLARAIKARRKDRTLKRPALFRLAILELKLGVRNRYGPATPRFRSTGEMSALLEQKGIRISSKEILVLLKGRRVVKDSFPGAYEEFGKFIETNFAKDPAYLKLRGRYSHLSSEAILRLLLHKKSHWHQPEKLSREDKTFLRKAYQEALGHLDLLWKGRTLSDENKRRRLEALRRYIEDNSLSNQALARRLRVSRSLLRQFLHGSGSQRTYLRGAYDLIGPFIKTHDPDFYQRLVGKFQSRVEWQEVRDLVLRIENQPDRLAEEERGQLRKWFEAWRRDLSVARRPLSPFENNMLVLAINGNTLSAIAPLLPSSRPGHSPLSSKGLRNYLYLPLRMDRIPLSRLIEETVRKKKLPVGSEVDFWRLKFAAGHRIEWHRLSEKDRQQLIHSLVADLANQLHRKPRVADLGKVPIKRFGGRTLYPLIQYSHWRKQRDAHLAHVSLVEVMKRLYRLDLAQTDKSTREGGPASDGGQGRLDKDFTINIEGNSLDLLDIALKGEATKAQMEEWIARLQMRDQLPIPRSVSLTSIGEAQRRLGTSGTKIRQLIRRGVIAVDQDVQNATGAKFILIESLNHLIGQKASIVPLGQLVRAMDEYYGIEPPHGYKYVNNIATLVGTSRANEIFGKTDLTYPILRTVISEGRRKFQGIRLLDVWRLGEELKRLQGVLKTWPSVTQVTQNTAFKGEEVHRRIRRGLLRTTALSTTLKVVSPPTKGKTTYLHPEDAEKVTRLRQTIEDPEIGLVRVRPSERRWHAKNIVELWKTLEGKRREAFLFELQWYNGLPLVNALFAEFEKSRDPVILDILRQVGTSFFVKRVAERAARVGEKSEPKTIESLGLMINLLGELDDPHFLKMLGVISQYHPVRWVQLAATRNIDRIEGRAEPPPGFIPVPEDHVFQMGDSIYHRGMKRRGIIVKVEGEWDEQRIVVNLRGLGPQKLVVNVAKPHLWISSDRGVGLGESADDGGQKRSDLAEKFTVPRPVLEIFELRGWTEVSRSP